MRLVIEIFLWAGVNPNWRDRVGNNALHSAVTAAWDGIQNKRSDDYMSNINQVIRVLLEKRTDMTGLPQAYIDYISSVPAETLTLGGQSDWERTRPVPIYNGKQQQVKWQAVSDSS